MLPKNSPVFACESSWRSLTEGGKELCFAELGFQPSQRGREGLNFNFCVVLAKPQLETAWSWLGLIPLLVRAGACFLTPILPFFQGRTEKIHLLMKFPLTIYIKKGKLLQEAHRTFITLNI